MQDLSTTTIKSALTVAVVATGVVQGLAQQEASAAILIRGIEKGGDVIVTLSGDLDVTDLTPEFSGIIGTNPTLTPFTGSISFASENFAVDTYDDIDNGANLIFGDGTGELPDVNIGFFLITPSFNALTLPQGYSGETLTGSLLFENSDFDSLGITTGVYSSGFNNNNDTITYEFQAVPEPITILGTGVALGFGAIFKGKKRKN